MSEILDLIKNEKVEWKTLGEVCEIKNGYTPSKKNKNFWENGTVPWFRLEDIRKNGRILYKAVQTVTKEAVKGGKLFEKNSVILSTVATIGEYALIKVDFLTNQQITVLTIKSQYKNYISSKFLMYYSYFLGEECKKIANVSGSVKIINNSQIKNIKIPIPSLKTQEKIVKILDNFTKYVTELEAELEARTKQYNYYRDMLLSENYLQKLSEKLFYDEKDKIINYTYLENLIKIKNGKDWKSLGKGNIPVYGSGGEMGMFVDKFSYDKPTVLIPRKGSIENIFYLDKPFWNVDTIFYTEIDDKKIIPKYFYYFMENYDLKSLSINPTRPSLNQSLLNKIILTLPSIKIQNQVVKILDKFQELIKNVDGLLPEEIEKRQNQYEYYREKLLTFEAKYDTTQRNATQRNLNRDFFNLLKEAADLVGVKLNFGLEWKTLGEICDIYLGLTYTPKYTESGIKFISAQNISKDFLDLSQTKYISETEYINSTSNAKPQKGDILFVRVGSNLGHPVIIDADEELCMFVSLGSLRVKNESILNKYIKYWMSTDLFWEQVRKNVHGSAKVNLNTGWLKEFKILMPSLEVQNHTVNILDKFDNLVNNIQEGLPKEIELRQKQYEYFREQLLSFEKN